jgi:hypothetical protein
MSTANARLNSKRWGKPFTLRFDVVNLLDQVYELRDGTGIGVVAPQFGPPDLPRRIVVKDLAVA